MLVGRVHDVTDLFLAGSMPRASCLTTSGATRALYPSPLQVSLTRASDETIGSAMANVSWVVMLTGPELSAVHDDPQETSALLARLVDSLRLPQLLDVGCR